MEKQILPLDRLHSDRQRSAAGAGLALLDQPNSTRSPDEPVDPTSVLRSAAPTAADWAAYLEMGQGAPVLLLHGFLGEGHCWQPLMQLLQDQFRCISLDLLGFGASAKPKIRYDIEQEVHFLRAFLQTLGLSRVHLIGHSFGGWVASAYAIAYPEAVDRLVLVAPAGIRDDEFCGRYNHLRPLLWPNPTVDWGLQLLQPIAQLLGQAEAFRTIQWARRELKTQPAARSFLLERLRPEDAIDTVETQIHRIQAPTLVIGGTQDRTIPLWHCQTYADRIANAQLQLLEADHALPQNHAEAIALAVRPFFS